MATSITIHYEASASDEILDTIEAGLLRFNQAQSGFTGGHALVLTLRDPAGTIVGGLIGTTLWEEWLYIDVVWVDDAVRGLGYGTLLLEHAETEAMRRGCHGAYLDTFDFQARAFYEKHGYRVFGALPHFPREHTRYWMQKDLVLPSPDGSEAQRDERSNG